MSAPVTPPLSLQFTAEQVHESQEVASGGYILTGSDILRGGDDGSVMRDNTLDGLNNQCIAIIANYLCKEDAANLACVNKRMYGVIDVVMKIKVVMRKRSNG